MDLEYDLLIKKNNNFSLDKEDYQVLFIIYKPLLSSDSLDYYLSLYEVSSDKKISSLLLNDILNNGYRDLDITKDFIEELEKVRLIKKISKYNIELYPPMTKEDAIKYILPYTMSVISTKNLNLIKDIFNITEVYPKDIRMMENIPYSVRKTTIPFSFNEFKSSLKDNDIIISSSDRFFYESISSIFNLNLLDMIQIMYEVEDINKDSLIDKCIKRRETRKEKENIINNTPLDYKERLDKLKDMKPEDVLSSSIEHISDADLSIIDRLRKLNLSEPLISLLVAYSLVINDNKMPSYNYFEKIANDWKNKKIKDIYEANDYIIKKKENRKSTKEKKDISYEDWLDNYYKEWKKISEEQNEQ